MGFTVTVGVDIVVVSVGVAVDIDGGVGEGVAIGGVVGNGVGVVRFGSCFSPTHPEKITRAPVITKNSIKRLKFLLPMFSHPVANCNHCSPLRRIQTIYL